ncbi:MAG: hypothetical protein ACI399_05230 [Candidatus Cryptobacteroides sp.]
MSNTFNFRRFIKIFVYDLHKSLQNFGITFLVLALLPILVPLFYGLMSICFSHEWSLPGVMSRGILFTVALVILILDFAPSVYGKLTDKKIGTEYLMIPASAFEKFLSMVLVTGLVIPLLFTLAYGLVDLLAIGVSLSEGTPLLKFMADNWVVGNSEAVLSAGFLTCLTIGLNSLVILLGSIFFKRFKVGKTLLAMSALSFLLSLLTVLPLSMAASNPEFIQMLEGLEEWLYEHLDKFVLYLNIFIDASFILQYAVVLTLIFLKVRTLKQ